MYLSLTDGSQLNSDVLLKAVQRFDLTPIPSTLELTLRVDSSITASLAYDSVVLAGVNSDRYRIIKINRVADTTSQSGNIPEVVKAVAVLDGFSALAWPLNRAVVKESRTLGEIYRSCGATARISVDVPIRLFACFAGMVATLSIAQALQEEACVPVWSGGSLSFRRIDDLFAGKPVESIATDTAHRVESPFLERHEVPWAMSTDNAGNVLSQLHSARQYVYLPRTPQRVLNNMSRYLAVRRVLPGSYAGHIKAGDGIDIAGTRYVVVTAAHSWETDSGGQGSNQVSRFWLGEFTK